MKLIHLTAIAMAVVAFSPGARAQPAPSVSAVQQFISGLDKVSADIQTIQLRAERGDDLLPYEPEIDALAIQFASEAGVHVGKAKVEANTALVDLSSTPPRLFDATAHLSSACMLAGWAANSLQSCFNAALTPPIGTWLTVTNDIKNVTAELITVRTMAGCP